MGGGAVALVLAEAVAGMGRAHRDHQAVALVLGEDRGGGDGGLGQVALDDRGGWGGQIAGQGVAIYDDMAGRNAKGGDGALHRQKGRLADVEAVNFFWRSVGDGPVSGLVFDLWLQLQAFLFAELFGIGQADDLVIRREDDRACGDRASPWATSGLVYAADQV